MDNEPMTTPNPSAVDKDAAIFATESVGPADDGSGPHAAPSGVNYVTTGTSPFTMASGAMNDYSPNPSAAERAPLDQVMKLRRDIGTVITVLGRKAELSSDEQAQKRMLQSWLDTIDAIESSLRSAGVTPPQEGSPSQDVADAMNDGRWQDATHLLLDKVDALYRERRAGAVPPAPQEPVIRLSRPLAAAPLISDEEWPDWVGDCAKWRGELLVGQDAHWCGDWDGLPVDETSSEYDCCDCFNSNSVFYQGRPKAASQGPAPARKEP